MENTRRRHVRGRMDVLRDAFCQVVGISLELGEIFHALVGAQDLDAVQDLVWLSIAHAVDKVRVGVDLFVQLTSVEALGRRLCCCGLIHLGQEVAHVGVVDGGLGQALGDDCRLIPHSMPYMSWMKEWAKPVASLAFMPDPAL